MTLIEDWKKIAPKLWSIRLSLLAAVMSSAQAGVEYFISGQRPVIAIITGLVALAAAVSRLIAQPGVLDDAK